MLVDGRVVAKNAELIQAGTVVEVAGPVASASLPVLPDDGEIEILHEGDGWLAINKRAGQPVHPLREGETGTVLNAVVGLRPEVQGVGESGLRSGIVHRLDVGTSGVLLVAWKQQAWELLREAFKTRAIVKRYLALVEGALEGEGRWEMDLRVAGHQPARVLAEPVSERPHRESRRCDLVYRSLEVGRHTTRVEVDLGTGFLHQIRAMMSAKRHPVVGDKLYGARLMTRGRPMLHAAVVEVDGVRIEASLPADYLDVMDRLGFATR